ncbi:MAG: hypothetical protein JXA95_12805 [Spirochaetales bacterium]|nr:hypothetical protein [Spirochaetales bacterium]
MEEDRIIRYEVVENSLGGDREWRGKILHGDRVNENNLIMEIVRNNTTITREEAQAVISLYEKAILWHLRQGHTVTTGLFRASLSLKGVFPGGNSSFDSRIHTPHMVIRPAKGVNKEVTKNLRFHKTRRSLTDQILSGIYDYTSGIKESNGKGRPIITRGGAFELYGGSLKIYGYSPEYELRLTGPDEEIYQASLIKVLPRKVTALAPAAIPPGDYLLGYRAKYGNTARDYGELPVTLVENPAEAQ